MNIEKVRKKLRTTAQLLAHLPTGHRLRGLQSINPSRFNKQVRNFLRTPSNPPQRLFRSKHLIANDTRQQKTAKKSPEHSGL
jgi:hypothetical protein